MHQRFLLCLLVTVLLLPAAWSAVYRYGSVILPNSLMAVVTEVEERPLFGVTSDERQHRAPSVWGWWTRDTQVYLEDLARNGFGLRRFFLQSYNQLTYSLLRSSRTYRELVVGKNRQLYGLSYIQDICAGTGRGRMTDEAVNLLVERLMQVATIFRRRDIPFEVVITPNKALALPHDIPSRSCPELDIAGTNYMRFVTAAAAKGLPLVDGQAITLAFQRETGLAAFPRGGLHWTVLAAVPTLRDFVQKSNDQRARPPLLIEPKVDTIVWNPPRNEERDLTDLTNTLWTDLNYRVPHPHLTRPVAGGTPFKLTIVGGSFTYQLVRLLIQTNAVEITRLEYFSLGRDEWSPDQGRKNAAYGKDMSVDVRRDLFDRDAVMLEINETALTASHAREFTEAVLTYDQAEHAGR